MTSFEEKLGIMPLADVLDRYSSIFPDSDIHKLQLEYEGPFLKYELVGNDGENRNTYEINAKTGDVIKERQKPLSRKKRDPAYRARKALNLEGLMDLGEIDRIAKEASQLDQSFQWELDRKKDRTIWKVELVDEGTSQVHEVKIDAHDGSLRQIKVKN